MSDKKKFVLELDEVPKLLFVSVDGLGKNDRIYIDGKLVGGLTDVTIESPLKGFTMYNAHRYVSDSFNVDDEGNIYMKGEIGSISTGG